MDYYDEDEYEEEPEENYHDPLKALVIALIVVCLLFAGIGVYLFLQLNSANERADSLSSQLTSVQSELDAIRAEQAAATPTPEPTAVPTPTPEPTPTPSPTPEPTATPSPTPEPTPVPLREAVTAEMLGDVYRPEDSLWLDEAETAVVVPYMLAVHYGPGMDWGENMALNMNDTVEILAKQNGWFLIRTTTGRYGWAAGEFLNITVVEATATPAPSTSTDAITPEAPATAAPTEATSPDLG